MIPKDALESTAAQPSRAIRLLRAGLYAVAGISGIFVAILPFIA